MKRSLPLVIGPALLASVAFVLVHRTLASGDAPAPNSLQGLKAVQVEISDPGERLSDRGITQGVIFAEVQLQLRRAGIEMLDPERSATEPLPGRPVLRVDVLANVHERYDQASFAIQIGLWQDVKLSRLDSDDDATVRAQTWGTGGIGESGTNWRDVLRGELAFYVDQFVSAWLEANSASTP